MTNQTFIIDRPEKTSLEPEVAQWRDRFPVGLRTLWYLTLFLVTLYGGGVALMYQIDSLVPQLHVELGWWRALGVVLLLKGLLGIALCTFLLVRWGEGANAEFDFPKRLVQAGPYRWVRNPITWCALAMLLGEGIALSSTGVLSMLPVAVVLGKLQSQLEERRLLNRFGDEYRQYCARVPRWIPQLRASTLTENRPMQKTTPPNAQVHTRRTTS